MAQRTELVELGFFVADSTILSMFYGEAEVARKPNGEFRVAWADRTEGWKGPERVSPTTVPDANSRTSSACLKLTLIDGATLQFTEVLYVNAQAFRWQVAHHVLVPGVDNDDQSYEVFESEWVAELIRSNELNREDCRHLKTNFNETWGTLEVVCDGVLVQKAGAPAKWN